MKAIDEDFGTASAPKKRRVLRELTREEIAQISGGVVSATDSNAQQSDDGWFISGLKDVFRAISDGMNAIFPPPPPPPPGPIGTLGVCGESEWWAPSGPHFFPLNDQREHFFQILLWI